MGGRDRATLIVEQIHPLNLPPSRWPGGRVGTVGRHHLDNARWGFDSNCFVCEPSNPAGLGIGFVHDDEAGLVEADFCLGSNFSGAPSYIHGGLVLAILDEAMAWAAIALGRSFSLTQTTSADFLRPVAVDRAHRVVARLDGRDGEGVMDLSAIVSRVSDGESCVRGRARFAPLSAGRARQAIGAEVGEAGGDYVRSPRR